MFSRNILSPHTAIFSRFLRRPICSHCNRNSALFRRQLRRLSEDDKPDPRFTLLVIYALKSSDAASAVRKPSANAGGQSRCCKLFRRRLHSFVYIKRYKSKAFAHYIDFSFSYRRSNQNQVNIYRAANYQSTVMIGVISAYFTASGNRKNMNVIVNLSIPVFNRKSIKRRLYICFSGA